MSSPFPLNRTKRLAAVIFICCCSSAPGLARPEDNLDRFARLISGFLDRVQRPSAADTLTPVILDCRSGERELNWLIEKESIAWLNNLGYDQVYQGEARDVTGHFIEIRPLRHAVFYRELGGELERSVSAEIYLKWLSPQREILYTQTLADTLSDTIGRDRVERIENENYPFTKGEIPRRFFNRYGEPLVVSLITGSMIYLFYSFRSK